MVKAECRAWRVGFLEIGDCLQERYNELIGGRGGVFTVDDGTKEPRQKKQLLMPLVVASFFFFSSKAFPLSDRRTGHSRTKSGFGRSGSPHQSKLLDYQNLSYLLWIACWLSTFKVVA